MRTRPTPAVLARIVATTDAPPDLTTDAGRWTLYCAAAQDPANHELLLEAATTEADRALAISVVAHMLERIPLQAHSTWLGALGSTESSFATRRSQELSILHNSASLTAGDAEATHPIWTNWLQLRLATTAPPAVRAVLATAGRTKRIRNLAK